jgi:hypothetical protein
MMQKIFLTQPVKGKLLCFIIIVAGFYYCQAQKVKNNGVKRDTIYFLSFLDLVEMEDHRYTGGSLWAYGHFDKKYDLTGEKEVMNKVIQRMLGKHFILLPVPDSCYKDLKVDSVSRRRNEFMEGICEKCLLNKNVILLDAVWEYLNDKSFSVLRGYHRSSGTSASYWIIGTWWDVHAFLFSPLQKKSIFKISRKYTQWQRSRPRPKWWPGLNHTRFFERPIKEVRRFLINSSSK